jgi:hypothetical protein
MTKKERVKTSGASGAKRPMPTAAVDRELQTKIGAQLRAMHDDIIGQGVPDRFQELLQRLDKSKPKG